MADYPGKLGEIIEDFEELLDRRERTELLIYYADQFVEVPDAIASRPFEENHRVPACESEAFVWSDPQKDGTLKLYFAVENPQGLSAKAMAAILDQGLSDQPPAEIAKVSSDIVFTLFGNDISMGKGTGLTGMVSMVKALAEQSLNAQQN
ncbi:MAG: SufE family protein [Chloroflexi bacterium]|nr:SufE family protein [Chloroflexota bacterium]